VTTTVTTKLDEMWTALEAYQPQANADGHGESWRVMCRERTTEATRWAYYVAPEGSAAESAALAAGAATWTTKAEYYAQQAIDALREVKP